MHTNLFNMPLFDVHLRLKEFLQTFLSVSCQFSFWFSCWFVCMPFKYFSTTGALSCIYYTRTRIQYRQWGKTFCQATSAHIHEEEERNSILAGNSTSTKKNHKNANETKLQVNSFIVVYNFCFSPRCKPTPVHPTKENNY